jgi:type IV pilus assembly protein PilV
MKINPESGIAKPAEKGFTLIEVLIGMLIMTIGLLGLAMMHGSSIQANAHADKMTQAAFLAQMKLEDLKSEELDPTGALTTDLSIDSIGDEVVGPHGTYNRTWAVAANTQFSRLITVTINWNDLGLPRTLTYTTMTRGGGN